jgi:hypothetical protein
MFRILIANIKSRVVSIGAETFTHVPLAELHVESEQLEFGDNMFSDKYMPAFYGKAGSTTEEYARAHGYQFNSTGEAAPKPPETAAASPVQASVYINNKLVSFEAYLINDIC